MCLQDWRLGRLIRASSRMETVATGAGNTVDIPSDKQRVGITISVNRRFALGTEYGQIRLDGVVFAILGNGQVNLHLTVATHGDLPMRELTLQSIGISIDYGIVEYTLPEEFLMAGMAEFKKAVGL